MRVRAKICGITRVQDAQLAVELGAEFVGLNFWPGSPRCLSLEDAEPVAEAVRGRATTVGVWVDGQQDQVSITMERLGLDLVQLHGDDEPGIIDRFSGRVIKAFRVGADFDPADLARYENAWGFLFDWARAGQYGGTGISWPYERIAGLRTTKPVMVAGGLGSHNVVEAVRRSGVEIVDVCSGVERSPGIKDKVLMQRFFEEVGNA